MILDAHRLAATSFVDRGPLFYDQQINLLIVHETQHVLSLTNLRWVIHKSFCR